MEIEEKEPRQPVQIRFSLLSRLKMICAKRSTADEKVKLYQIAEEAITKYLDEVEE